MDRQVLGRLLLQVGLHRNRIYILKLKIHSESIADYSQRPLYSLGEMNYGRTHHCLERDLNTELARASKWGAVVLMDEADVFMQERSANEYSRNEQVSGNYSSFRPAIELTSYSSTAYLGIFRRHNVSDYQPNTNR